MPNGVDAGDAVVSFLADTTALDAAYDRLAVDVPGKLRPADQAAQGLGNTLQGLSTSFGQAGETGEEAGDEIEDGMKRGGAAAREAKGELALLGEETGIRMPRHVRAFVSELPGVGEALQAAFSATAVLFLVQILVEGTKKLSEWVSNTFIFTEAMKDSNKEIVAQNAVLISYHTQIDAVSKAIADFGKTPLALAAEGVSNLTKKLEGQKQEFINNEQVQAAYRKGLDDVTQDMANKAGAANIALKAAIELQNDLVIQAQLNQARLIVETQMSTAKSTIDNEKSIADSKFKIWQASALLQANLAKNSALAVLDVEKDADQKEFDLKMASLRRLRNAQVEAEKEFKSIGDTENADKMAQEIKATDAKIEAETADHYAKEIKKAIDFNNKFKEIEKDIMALPARQVTPLGAFIDDFQKLEDAAAKLGVTLSGSLKEAFDANEKALGIMQVAYGKGQLTLKQYDQALLTDIQSQIAWQKSLGVSTTAMDKQVTALQNEINGVEKTNQLWDSFAAEFAKKSKNIGDEAQAMGSMIGKAGAQMDEAFASAMMGALQSGQSIGAALEKATASVLVNLATQAAAHALYCIAMGTAELALGVTSASAAEWFTAAAEFGLVAGVAGGAGLAMSGGGGGSGAGGRGGSQPITNQGGAINPIAGTFGSSGPNVKKFADGGLISGATLAIMGEGGPASAGNRPQEAAIPLDNPEAVAKIKEALGGGGGDTHHWHVRGLVSPDTLSKVADQLSGGVKKRKINLYSTNSFRIQKRST